MSNLQEIEQAVERLPLPDFMKLAVWIDRKRQLVNISSDQPKSPTRDHSAFLSSYAPEDEGLYDDAKAG